LRKQYLSGAGLRILSERAGAGEVAFYIALPDKIEKIYWRALKKTAAQFLISANGRLCAIIGKISKQFNQIISS
jgi:hypothetical protein